MKKMTTIAKEDLNQVVTLGLLRSELKKELKKYVTKDELHREFLYYNKSIIETMEMYLNRFEEKLVEAKDEFANAVKTHQEEVAAISYHQAENDQRLENHEGRIITVELRFADKE